MDGVAPTPRTFGAGRICSFPVVLLLVGCAPQPQPAVTDRMQQVHGDFPADYSGYWERNYARGGDIRAAYYQALDRLYATRPDQTFGGPATIGMSVPSRQQEALIALARLAEEVTDTDVLTISQTDYEIVIEREDDYAILCGFFDGMADPTVTDYGREVCGWAGKDLVAQLSLPKRLDVAHRFSISEDRSEMRVTTTITAPSSRVPFEISRFYKRFDRLPPNYNCVETLSKRRVCSYGQSSR